MFSRVTPIQALKVMLDSANGQSYSGRMHAFAIAENHENDLEKRSKALMKENTGLRAESKSRLSRVVELSTDNSHLFALTASLTEENGCLLANYAIVERENKTIIMDNMMLRQENERLRNELASRAPI